MSQINQNKVLLIGNFGARNLGDEMILVSALSEYPSTVVMTANPKLSQQFAEQDFKTLIPFPSGVRSLIQFLTKREIWNAYEKYEFDEVIFAGGGLFAIKLRAYLVWGLARAWVWAFYGKAKVKWTHQGVDQTRNPIKRVILKMVFAGASEVSVRDEQSKAFLDSLGIKHVKMLGDRAENHIKELNLNAKGKKILINARASVKKSVWKDIINKYGKENLVYVAMEESDAKFAPEGVETKYPETQTELLNVIKQGKVAIGQRLHFLLLARAMKVPQVKTLGKPYSQKVKNAGFTE